MKLPICCFYFIFALTVPVSILAQYTPQEEALTLFEDNQYSGALPIFKRLTSLFPKDPRYQYYVGVCMVQSNTELKKALDYLSFAAEKTVPRDVYFFIGKALLYQYKFNEALDAFLKFQQFGERSEKERWQCDNHIAMARNGQRLIEKECNVNVYKADTISRKELFSYYNRFLVSGKFREIADRSFPFAESKDRSTWRFVPSMLNKNEVVYESSSTPARKNRDLVTVRKNSDDSWSRPENLGSVINSSFDEDYAYFNASESALYFASKGHNSMGGYDVFKSIYNPNSKSWSAAINLGYPINTPYDDFLFVPSDDQTQAMFTSNRATHGDKLVTYTVSFERDYTYGDIPMKVDLNNRSNFRIIPKPLGENFKKETKHEQVYTSAGIAKKSTGSNAYPAVLLQQKDYNDQLNKALQFQLQSDSLSRVAEDLRQKSLTSKNEWEKDRCRKEILLLDQRSKAMQLKADEFYERARKYELQYAERNENSVQTTKISEDKVRKAFRKNDSGKSKQSEFKNVSSKNSENKPNIPTKSKSTLVYEFKVMAKSPYTSVDQIPLNQPLPAGLIYKIQMGAFSKIIEPDRFKGIIPISGVTLQKGAVTKYYAGLFNRFADAEKALNRIKEFGFADSYIVTFYDGKSIPINRAREIENDK